MKKIRQGRFLFGSVFVVFRVSDIVRQFVDTFIVQDTAQELLRFIEFTPVTIDFSIVVNERLLPRSLVVAQQRVHRTRSVSATSGVQGAPLVASIAHLICCFGELLMT